MLETIEPESEVGSLRIAQLKGRSNYLCLRRWERMHQGGLSPDETRLLVRTMVWLTSTQTGDRSELNLSSGEVACWSAVSAQAESCPGAECPYYMNGLCFLYRARWRAECSHIIITNHALLLSDMVSESTILPDSSYLIIDEAHHLEEEATQELGFWVGEGDLEGYLDSLSALLPQVQTLIRSGQVEPPRRREITRLIEGLRGRIQDGRERLAQLFNRLGYFVELESLESGEYYERHLRLTRDARIQPGWIEAKLSWDNLSLPLVDIELGLGRLCSALEGVTEGILDHGLMMELSSLAYRGWELRSRMRSVISHPEMGVVYWVSVGRRGVTLHAAPLEVGERLWELLFSRKDGVVLTSATLSTEGSFDYIEGRLGLRDFRGLQIGVSFDYITSTMIYIPNDIPEPYHPQYHRAVEGVLVELCRAAGGRTMVLFTSHAALKRVHAAIQPPLEREGILVLGQGVDGSAKQVLNTFRTAERCVLLGASSFWEGVDVMGETLSLLAIAKLPFAVPTDPVFAARSELFEDAFNQYTIPQAILRFKQGFGRLIRSKRDRGVMVILDHRIKSKYYGQAFLQSLPPCMVKVGPSRNMPMEVMSWLGP